MVFLTVHYLVSTSFQSWRVKSLHQKIARILDCKNTVVFLKQSDGSKQGIATALASSDICVNSSEATVQECIWSNELAQGIAIAPKQILYVNPFITFPPSPSLIPFSFASEKALPQSSKGDFVYALIEADLNPEDNQNRPVFEIEQLAHLIAWKIDTKLSILIKTDVKHFAQLIFATFSHNHYVINDRLTLSRIQTVNIDGTPQDFNQVLIHMKKDARVSEEMSEDEWKKHLEFIKGMGVFANQASEFELKKNLTEGKTGIVQPDLIPAKSVVEVKKKVSSPDTPKKSLLSLEKTGVKIQELRNRSHPNLADLVKDEEEVLESPTSPKFPLASPKKSPSISIASKASLSPKFPVASPAKKAFEFKEPKSEKKIEKEEILRVTEDDVKSVVSIEIEEVKEVANGSAVVEQPKVIEVETLPDVIESKSIPEAKKSPLNAPVAPKLSNAVKYKPIKLPEGKPPNVLVYSDSATTRDNVIKTLSCILSKNMYSIYPLSVKEIQSKIWIDNTILLVVCGSINGSDISQLFLEYFFRGGKVLCLCSDLLRQVLPTYHTAEVREHELVQFSYGKWKNIKMMHHIFCYQPSPIRKHFSQDSDDVPRDKSPNSNPLTVLPRSVELRDEFGIIHNLNVQILGTEDTWKTPSLLMVSSERGGKMIFSQIHLEMDPSFYESDEQKYQILMKNEALRHEIFGDVLNTHLGLVTEVKMKEEDVKYTKGYFLGRHELKFEVLELLNPLMDGDKVLKLDGLSMKFFGKNETPGEAKSNYFPIMVHMCPDDFSTIEYFDTLKTESVGRLMIYTHILKSTTYVVKTKYKHGFAVVSRLLTEGKGRGGNKWISPDGCLMFNLQLHIPLSSPLGRQIGLIQHLIAAALVSGIRSLPGYKELPLGIKWPNDVYVNGETKIGGLIVTSTLEGDLVICDIGLGVNLSNSSPTTCINDVISDYNKKHSANLKPLSYEKTLAIIFNETENILNRVQSDDVEYFYNLYYTYWLHTDTSVTVVSPSGHEESGNILGIDDSGYLKIKFSNDKIGSVTPDNNSFDLLRGLIVPKYQV